MWAAAPKAIQSQSNPTTNSGEAKTSKPDDAGAKQRRRLDIGECSRNRIRERRRDLHIFRKAAVNGVAREVGALAEILPAGAAKLARATGTVEPRDAHSCTRRIKRCLAPAAFDYSDYLVTWNDGREARRQLALDDVQIGSTYPAGADSNQNFVGLRFRSGKIDELEWRSLYRRRRMEYACAHGLAAITRLLRDRATLAR